MICRAKVCGIREAAGLDAAVAAGVAAVGLNFYPPSPRYLEPARAVELRARIPLWVDVVALFVNEQAERIAVVAGQVSAGSVQLHGTVTLAQLRDLRGLRRILAVPAVRGETLRRIEPLLTEVEAVLLDASVPGLHGGSGQTADWAEAAAVRAALQDLPLILAGGLTPENVAEAIEAVEPYAVDVASGVESAPGVKDPERIRAFMAAVRRMGS